MFEEKQKHQLETDELLALQVGKKSVEAFNELYKRYGQKMFSYFFRMLWKNKELAEDCTQELFVKIFNHAYRFEQGRNFSTWLYSIAHNMCKNEYRKQEVKMKHRHVPVVTSVGSGELAADLQKFKIALLETVNRLAEEKKTLYILRFEEQLSVPDISQVLSIPEGTVKSRIFHLMKELKDELKAFKNLHIYP